MLCLINVTDRTLQIDLDLAEMDLSGKCSWSDLLSDDAFPAQPILHVTLRPYQSRWLKQME